MTRLVVVSNRVAAPSPGQAAGGLAVCLVDAMRDRGGLWFGWNGELVAQESDIAATCLQHGRCTLMTMPLTERDHREFYLGFSNEVLWPIHHYRLDLSRFTLEAAEGYRRVNARFADMLAPHLRRTDLIWVHDYHLIPLGADLRARGVGNQIGFFLHIPFPPPEILRAAPEYERLARTVLDYDLIGFQTAGDHANFCRFVCEALGGERVGLDTVRLDGKYLQVGVFPAGIDVGGFATMAANPEGAQKIQKTERRDGKPLRAIGVDRLDYSKGLPEKFRAFRRLLDSYPEDRRPLTLIQVASPTRDDLDAYIDIRHELEALSGKINGKFGDFDWTPLRYIHRAVARETLAVHYRACHIGLVTPLRDGMNLVAKEYVAAQDEADPGVLILSRFAGAAEDLQEALLVNPYDIDETAHAMRRAIEMPREERIARYRALMKRVRKHDAGNWMLRFLRALRACRGSPRISLPRAAAGRVIALTERRPSRSTLLP
ncbi:alpha,alpha-trehalose-phosphate synthase [Rhodoblastus acidophilus]|uniref:Alpha,alpha-trehalose-phosphate synthase n=1 Tax=Rhodoblastus acidophilus TaxID=1074 RepID=A0A6N8DQG9_RHOAC|nr:trehalose-6-phosphate synthase [Rhodoblastus acidophilus]MCW2276141.1 trehalose 6-phosphate synthase [Rhodoblastus acidophilus]MTV32810.1 alpha,alpha-trehalose-phosphate synthase [Rhodoblastus acidophilus]